MNNYYFFSIIIPTYNRAFELEKLIPSLMNLNYPKDKYEIIISDDGSTDNTENLINEFSKSTNIPIKYIKHENVGPGESRNIGMANSKGDFMIFLDSDTIIPENWLYEINKFIINEKCDAFGGPDKSLDSFPDKVKAIDYSMTSFIGTGGLRGKKGKALAKYYPRSFNMGISRKVYETIGGMCKLRHGQDIEFSHRIHKAGFKVSFIPEAYVYHLRRTNFKKFFKQVFNWGVARINLWQIDRGMLEPLHTFPAIGVFIYILSFFLIFINPIPFLILTLLGLLVLLYGFFESYMRYKSIKVSFLSIIALILQIFGYGLGFLYAIIRLPFSKGKVIKGFTKNYYK